MLEVVQLDVIQLFESLEERRLAVTEHLLRHDLNDVIELARETSRSRLVEADRRCDGLLPRRRRPVEQVFGLRDVNRTSDDRRIQVEVVAVNARVDVHFRRQSQLSDNVIQ